VSFGGQERQVAVSAPQQRLLDVLPPEGRDASKWRELHAKTDDGRSLTLRRYADDYADYDALLYRDASGNPALGIFRRITPDMPARARRDAEKPHLALANPTHIEIRTDEVAEAPKPENLTVVLDGSEQTFDLARLAALPRKEPPSGKGSRGKGGMVGVELRDVVDLIQGVDGVAHVKLVARDEDLLLVRGEALRDPEARALLRMNRRGQLGLSLWEKPGSEPRRLRDIVKLIIATR
jgi:hypothetical protein